MNELICSVLMAKTRNALLEAIRMITCVPTIKEQDAIWIQSCLEDLYRISFSTQPISNPTTSTAFNTVRFEKARFNVLVSHFSYRYRYQRG